MASMSDEYSIRPARENDLPALTEIYNAAVTGTTFTGHLAPLTTEERRPWWEAHLDPRYPILAAETGGEILGYACLSAWAAVPLYERTVESSLYLAPAAQGRGLGTRLMQALLAEGRRLGHHVVISRIWAQNGASIAMCRKCGYEETGVQKEVGWRNDHWEDCVILQVIL